MKVIKKGLGIERLGKAVFAVTFSFLLFTNSASFAQWVVSHDPIFQPTFPKPAKLVPFQDPRFGTTLTRITDARSEGFPGIFPQYSKRQAWNSDQSWLLLFEGTGRALLYDGSTYQFEKMLDGVGGEDVFWHPSNPSVILYSADNVFRSYNVETDSVNDLHSFPNYTWINTRGEGNLSRDGRYYAFVGQVYDTVTHFRDIVVYDIVRDSVIAMMVLPQTLNDFDWVSISPLGNYVVVDYATSDTGRYQGIEVYNRNLNFIWQKPLGAGHSDLGVDASGDEVLVMAYYNAMTNSTFIKKFRLSDGSETSLIELSWQFDLHISCRNELRREWCFISTFDNEARLTDDSLSWLPFEDEIFALKLDGSGEVQRIAHHHSRRFSPITPNRDSSVYWAEPHATVSSDGGRIIFGSNWRENVEQDSSIDAYVVDFRNMLGVNEESFSPLRFRLERNYPNPFNPTTTICFSLPQRLHATLKVFDVLGREVATLVNGEVDAGKYEVSFDASKFSSGIYYYRLTAVDTKTGQLLMNTSRKAILLK